MTTFKEVVEYLKDNPQGYWFKRRLYGWGWVPVKWQGWAVLGAFLFFLAMNGLSIASKPAQGDADLVWFFIKTAVMVAALMVICYKKGERPRWQWGIPRKDGEGDGSKVG